MGGLPPLPGGLTKSVGSIMSCPDSSSYCRGPFHFFLRLQQTARWPVMQRQCRNATLSLLNDCPKHPTPRHAWIAPRHDVLRVGMSSAMLCTRAQTTATAVLKAAQPTGAALQWAAQRICPCDLLCATQHSRPHHFFSSISVKYRFENVVGALVHGPLNPLLSVWHLPSAWAPA